MEHPQINVMHIIGDLNRAGAQEVVRTLIEYLMVDGCTPIVCTLRDGPLRQNIENLGIKVEIVGARRYGFLAGPWFIADLLRIRREFIDLINKHDVQIIQTHLLAILDFLTLTLRYGTKLQAILWTMHNVNFLPEQKQNLLITKFKRLLRRLLYRSTSSGVNMFIAVSEEVSQSMIRQLGSIENKIVTINNGVDVKRYERPENKQEICHELELDETVNLIMVVGRLTRQKGHQYLIEAAPKIIKSHPNTHFLFVGDGELKDELRTQVNKIDLTEKFHFLGNRSDVPDLLASVDIFAMPSLWEGMAMALLEAMAAGKPIVATDVSGTNQVMIPNKTGLIIPPGDSQTLAEAIIQLLSDPAKAQVLGQAAKKHVTANYSARKQADEHIALYHRLLA